MGGGIVSGRSRRKYTDDDNGKFAVPTITPAMDEEEEEAQAEFEDVGRRAFRPVEDIQSTHVNKEDLKFPELIKWGYMEGVSKRNAWIESIEVDHPPFAEAGQTRLPFGVTSVQHRRIGFANG